MVATVVIWGALVPATLAFVLLAVAWRRRASASGAGGPWAAALAVGLAYVVGSWGMGSATAGDPNLRLLVIALAGAGIGLVESLLRVPRWASWSLRIAASSAAAWLVVGPLVAPQQWGLAQVGLRVGVIAGATVMVWTAIDLQAAAEEGPSLALALALLAAGGSAVVLMSGLASTAQVAGALVAALGVGFLLSWRYPARARLRSAAPVVALLLVGHGAVGLLYAEMPPLSFGLLALTPLGLLLGRLGRLRRARAVAALALRLLVVSAPVGAAVATAAIPYFGLGGPTPSTVPADQAAGDEGSEPSVSGGSGDDEDYGY